MELAAAMDIPSTDIVTADLMGSDSAGVGVSNSALGAWFPTQGGTFALLSTGNASDAATANTSGSTGSVLGDLNNSAGTDLVRLHLQLTVPSTANCASFDFAFYSEEYPEFVGSSYNDTFTAQLNDSTITLSGNTVTAPGNFALDPNGNIIEINSSFGFTVGTGTTYDGSTPLLRASTAVVANTTIDLYLSVQDLGDSAYDTAVFLDKWAWTDDPNCLGGAAVGGDSDGDGLLDVWETEGLRVSVGGTEEFVDLKAMGADPNHKDIFVEIDWMPGRQPMAAAIATVVTAFNNAGIHLHVDYGPASPLTYGAAATWGALSHGNEVPNDPNLGTSVGNSYDWTEFTALKKTHLTPGRAAVAHYNIWAQNLSPGLGTTSGISRGITASDFIVSLGGWTTPGGTLAQQTGTFMHELGHNLSLRHGGADNTNHKPNYLSIMNYAFQLTGLIEGGTYGHFDYSNAKLPDLVETALNEAAGVGVAAAANQGTLWSCPNGTLRAHVNASAVDWNCDGDATDGAVNSSINRDAAKETLTSYHDWANINFKGGAIGAPGASDESLNLPMVTERQDITEEEAKVIEDVIRAAIAPPTVGLVDPTTGEWHLSNSATDVTSFYYGNPGDVPFMGDWDCDGVDTPGLFRQSDAFAYLRNSNTQGNAEIRFFFGNPSDVPLAGDFDGDSCDTLSIYRPSEQRFYIVNKLGENEGGLGAADFSFLFGNPGDKPVVGDWDGDGIDEVGLHRESTGFFYWRNTLDTGIASGEIFFGDPGDRFVAGDWGTVDGIDTPAIYRPSDFTVYFRHSLTQGIADSVLMWTNVGASWLPVAGAFGLG
jgi:hypothetical protein